MSDRQESTSAKNHGDGDDDGYNQSQLWSTSSTFFSTSGMVEDTEIHTIGGFSQELETEFTSTNADITSSFTSTSGVVQERATYNSGWLGESTQKNAIPHTQSVFSGSPAEVEENEGALGFAARHRVSLDPIEEAYLAEIAMTDGSITSISGFANTLPGEDPWFYPDNSDFDLYRWLHKLIRMLNKSKLPGERPSVAFQNLHVLGTRSTIRYNWNMLDILTAPLRPRGSFNSNHESPKPILQSVHGVLNRGELLLVLGRLESGCSSLAKALCGEFHGLQLNSESAIYHGGMPQQTIPNTFKTGTVYNSDFNGFFPSSTVGQTLEFAVSARTSSNQLKSVSRKRYTKLMAKVIGAVFELRHVYKKRICDISTSEHKRLAVAEMVLSGGFLAAWNNPTQGTDSYLTLNFIQSLRLAADLGSSSHIIPARQVSQAIYDLFDKTVLLHEGRQIYYGSTVKVRQFFEHQGWYCGPQQTTADFLAAITNPASRKLRPGFEGQVPRTPDEFEAYWHQSSEFLELQREMASHQLLETSQQKHEFPESRQNKSRNSKYCTWADSPYTSLSLQIKLCIKSAYQRAWNEPIALIIGSMFHNTPDTTSGFFAKGAVIFYMVLLNSFIPISEISSHHSRHPIVQKHALLGFYHPAIEAIAHFLIIYFMSNLRREPSQFFLCLLINFLTILVTSAAFQANAAIAKTVSQAIVLAGLLVLPVTIYTGFIIPVPQIHPWFKFIRYLTPTYYAFESLVANEFHGRHFGCAAFVPSYPNIQNNSFICSAVGAVAGQWTVSGDDYIRATYEFTYHHVWRNFGILIAMMLGWMMIHLVVTEMISYTNTAPESLSFRRGNGLKKGGNSADEETGQSVVAINNSMVGDAQNKNPSFIPAQQGIFTWRDVTYKTVFKREHRQILDQVTGWVKPGSLMAVMSVNEIERKAFLEILAQHTTVGVFTGDMFINSRPVGSNSQRKFGYIQKQDLHLETATVRESLQFSALLRQPSSVSKEEKYAYVEEIIRILCLEEIAEAFVGVPGEGLNREQRKLLSIGVELAAKPQILFLDEPTSGLDEHGSRAIWSLLRKLANAGQAIVCTIHQPSASIFKQCDQLLLLTNEGKTAYFGPTGENSLILLDYFHRNEAHRAIKDNENPAEYIMEVLKTETNKNNGTWSSIWSTSREAATIQEEIKHIHSHKQTQQNQPNTPPDPREHGEFALPLRNQLPIILRRISQHYHRTPLTILSRIALTTTAFLFIGFSFYKQNPSLHGLQGTLFSLFMLCALFPPLVQQTIPTLHTHISLYIHREHHSRTYSWLALLLCTLLIELPHTIFLAITSYASYTYPIFNIQSPPQQGLTLLFFLQYFLSATTFAIAIAILSPTPQLATLLTYALSFLSISFNGIMQPPSTPPLHTFWIFMYRISPFTYLVSGISATQLHNRAVKCSTIELSTFHPPSGQSCAEYLGTFLQTATGYLVSPDARDKCEYCAVDVADQFLAQREYFWDERWRNWAVGWGFVVFNLGVAGLALYYRVRVGGLGRMG
ncbi:hypothetical protein BO70DRAFT_387710 [Aspergillus heteromorphus CBS 117.55]|uniref:ABC transporter domain-containing protein n=1 Tax=Aspergillus heteromorphus CBS 117.55 TaxID=1448321 RepID=A0A317W2M8_9EURO|nr:uncharacterized protein BO70DRAFT_387710 [Aspergillus heteromorphus CBS 117.55]PWY80723.1 hypothetical protein BO70DRAFT_387710 [Aspergillus heteromorphus CBS 117.55]